MSSSPSSSPKEAQRFQRWLRVRVFWFLVVAGLCVGLVWRYHVGIARSKTKRARTILRGKALSASKAQTPTKAQAQSADKTKAQTTLSAPREAPARPRSKGSTSDGGAQPSTKPSSRPASQPPLPLALRHGTTRQSTPWQTLPQSLRRKLAQSMVPLTGAEQRMLYKARREAVARGMYWMAAFVLRRWDVRKLGIDGVYIFAELADNTPDQVVQQYSLRIAQLLARRMERYYLAESIMSPTGDLMDALDLVTRMPGLKLDPQLLLRYILKHTKRLSLPQAVLKPYPTLKAPGTEDDIYDKMINAYILERASVQYPQHFSRHSGLFRMLRFLHQRPLVDYAQDKSPKHKLFNAHAFLATHIAFIHNNYGRLPLRPVQAPTIFRFLHRNFESVLQRKDTELVGEFVDVFRAMGKHENNSQRVRRGTRYLLASQRPDGSWGPWEREKNVYDAVHHSWCAVHGLRSRQFRRQTPYAARIRQLEKRLRQR